jgi:CheY-like chemotaxis protein
MLRCLIGDDNARFLEAARGLLKREGVAVVGVASTGAEAAERGTIRRLLDGAGGADRAAPVNGPRGR